MTESEFEALAGAALAALESAFEASAPGADVQTKGEGVLEIEIWVAAKSGGFHFRHDGTAWRDTRDGTELFAAVSRLASQQAGSPVVLSAR